MNTTERTTGVASIIPISGVSRRESLLKYLDAGGSAVGSNVYTPL